MNNPKERPIDWNYIGKVFEARLSKRQLESIVDTVALAKNEYGMVPKIYKEDDLTGVYVILSQTLCGKMLTVTPEEAFEYLQPIMLFNKIDNQ